MGRNSKSSSAKRNPVCEKLLRALGVYPKIIKLGPHPNRQEEPEMEIKKQKANNNHNKKLVVIGGGGDEMEKEGKKSGSNQDVNDVFSDYISRAKRRLGSISISSKGHDFDSGKKENLKDDLDNHRFSDYIIRARNKLNKATSSSTRTVGWTKSTSIN